MSKRRGRGEGTIQQRANGTWYAQFSSPDGRKTFSGRTKIDVQRKLREAQAKADEKTPATVTSKMTVRGLFSFWLENVITPTRSAATANQYARNVRLWIDPIIGDERVDAIDAEHMDAIMQRMAEAETGGSYRQLIRIILTRCFAYAMTRQLITTNPAASIPFPRREHREFTALTADQVKAFFHAVKDERLACLWHTAFQTGLRIGELLSLQKTDVDFARGLIHVHRTQTIVAGGRVDLKSPKTRAGRRSVTIGATLVKQLREHLERMRREGLADSVWLFCDKAGEMLLRGADPGSSFVRTLARAGLPKIRIHDTRHTHATLLLAAGVNVKVVSERLGHADVVITLKTYGHVMPNMQADAASQVDAILG